MSYLNHSEGVRQQLRVQGTTAASQGWLVQMPDVTKIKKKFLIFKNAA